MEIEKRIGKIQKIRFGHGGYQDACLGITIELGSGSGWGVGDFKGTWACEPDNHCKWTKDDQTKAWGEMCQWLNKLLSNAKVDSMDKLVGKPVEVEFEGMRMKSWRILEEAI